MKSYDKIFTDNPFIDELIYFTKIIAVNAVIKDSDKADENPHYARNQRIRD